jgi:transcriptional regulator with XRE-family HTH domain
MSQISENLKVVRKHLDLTQLEFSKILEIGFRTYVRYEIGERETPIPVLVKISKLNKISLDELILSPLVINDFRGFSQKSFSEKNKKSQTPFPIENEPLVTSKKDEINLLNLFRGMNLQTQKKYLVEMEWLIKEGKTASENKNIKKVAKLKNSSDIPKRVGEKS